ncbi:MAG TPA: asparagine--tRNA ligase [Terriglobales bacterium]|nr:asparagine--tRNA ligase [Terriglobales bacterium]
MDETSPTPAPALATIRDIGSYDGQRVRLRGWLYNLRESGKLLFPILRDGTGWIQGVVFKKNVPAELFDALKGLPQESSLEVVGQVRADARAPGGFELDIQEATILQAVDPARPYPITPKEHGIEFLMEHRHLWLRSQRQAAILRVRHEIIKAVRDFFDGDGFVLGDAPILTPASCEGTSNLFEVEYFDQKAYLTQSGQLYAEAVAMAVGKTYCFGPTFRAEKSKTRRHLTEFWMVEPEVAFATLDDVMHLAERLVAFVVGRVLEKRRPELALLERNVAKLEAIQLPFPRVSYDEAVARVNAAGGSMEYGTDLGGGDETLLSQQFERPVMVHRYPAAVKAFYMQPDPERPNLALCVDMLAPEGFGEIIGGSQRIHDLGLLLQRIEEHKLPTEPIEWYLDLRRYGTVPHGGFGMGIERVVGWICGLEHVREAIPFPRTIYRLQP